MMLLSTFMTRWPIPVKKWERTGAWTSWSFRRISPKVTFLGNR